MKSGYGIVVLITSTLEDLKVSKCSFKNGYINFITSKTKVLVRELLISSLVIEGLVERPIANSRRFKAVRASPSEKAERYFRSSESRTSEVVSRGLKISKCSLGLRHYDRLGPGI
jgi:hypothetical protein